MRLRSTQFVFLMLVLCSVQIRQEYALQLMADAFAGHSHAPAQERKAAAKAAELTRVLTALALPAHPTLSLAPQSIAAERTPWTMSHPASASTAVASHTSLIRA
jgi:hypothetical protein